MVPLVEIEIKSVKRPSIAVHGGAGDWSIDRDTETSVRRWIEEALISGYEILKRGGSSIDAVTEAVATLEDSGIFNAGSGSALNALGYAELDAGVMEGYNMYSGSVASVKSIKNPVRLARLVMDNTSHVMLCCDGAEKLASALGLRLEGFSISERILNRYRDLVSKALSSNQAVSPYIKGNIEVMRRMITGSLGDTVGAVAIDREGRLAAATSTGGVWLKLPGRIGDSPIPGSGFYADRHIACSATGLGEAIMTISLCRSIAIASRFLGSVAPAVAYTFEELESIPRFRGFAHAGVIVMEHSEKLYMTFNTRGMARGYISSDTESLEVSIYR